MFLEKLTNCFSSTASCTVLLKHLLLKCQITGTAESTQIRDKITMYRFVRFLQAVQTHCVFHIFLSFASPFQFLIFLLLQIILYCVIPLLGRSLFFVSTGTSKARLLLFVTPPCPSQCNLRDFIKLPMYIMMFVKIVYFCPSFPAQLCLISPKYFPEYSLLPNFQFLLVNLTNFLNVGLFPLFLIPSLVIRCWLIIMKNFQCNWQ